LDLFTCPQPAYGQLRLTPQACASQWKAARHARPWDRFALCRGCPIGATHAGEAMPDPQDDDPHRCLYCGRRGLRLVSRLVCISCANRIFELLRGRYRRIAPPKFKKPLLCFSVEIEEPSQ